MKAGPPESPLQAVLPLLPTTTSFFSSFLNFTKSVLTRCLTPDLGPPELLSFFPYPASQISALFTNAFSTSHPYKIGAIGTFSTASSRTQKAKSVPFPGPAAMLNSGLVLQYLVFTSWAGSPVLSPNKAAGTLPPQWAA